MMLALTRRQRVLLLAFSVLGYVLWASVCGQVLLAHDGQDGSNATWSAPQPKRSQPVGTAIRRDPFAGKPLPQPEFSQTSTGVRVPDIGEPPAPDASALEASPNVATFELKATIAGEHPLAYVQNGTAIEIVHPGSRLGERTIKRIGLRGIVFGDGTSLELSSSSGPFEGRQPRPKRASELDDLRALIVKALRRGVLPGAALPGASAAPTAASSPSPAAPFATMPPAAATADHRARFSTGRRQPHLRSERPDALPAAALASASLIQKGLTDATLSQPCTWPSFVLERRQRESPALAAGELISLDVRDLDIYDAVRLLATQASVNVVVDNSVSHHPVTLRLQGVSFERALGPSPKATASPPCARTASSTSAATMS